jgi:hypothetical protein
MDTGSNLADVGRKRCVDALTSVRVPNFPEV